MQPSPGITLLRRLTFVPPHAPPVGATPRDRAQEAIPMATAKIDKKKTADTVEVHADA